MMFDKISSAPAEQGAEAREGVSGGQEPSALGFVHGSFCPSCFVFSLTEQLALFPEEQLLLDGLFGQIDSIPSRNLVLNHLANLQLTYGLTSHQAEVLFLISVILVGIEQGLIPVSVGESRTGHSNAPYDSHDGSK